MRAVTAGGGGTRLVVVDRAKWIGVNRSHLKIRVKQIHAQAKRVGDEAREAVEVGLREAQKAGIKEWRALLEKADAAYQEAYAQEAAKRYNTAGRQFGFKVERF